jgi:large subunit ribosomal protein L25
VHPVEGRLLHVDFLRIQMDTVIEVDVPVLLKGEAAGVKLDGGILEPVTRQVRVSCLPGDIPEHLDMDVSAMKIGDHLSVSDLPVSDKYKVLSEGGLILAVCQPPAKEEAPAGAATAEAAPAPSEPEVIKKGKAATEGEGEKAEEGEKDKGEKKEARKPEGKK